MPKNVPAASEVPFDPSSPGSSLLSKGLRALREGATAWEKTAAALNECDSRELQRLLVQEGLSLLAQGLLLPFGLLRSRHRPLRQRDLRTVVFVHGLHANRGVFFPLQSYLRLHGFERQFSFSYRSTGSIEVLAVRLKHELDRNIKGGRIDIVAHSLGGLVARCYLQQLGGARRVDRLITLATPHHGSSSCAYLPTVLGSQLRPEGPFLTHLNALPFPEQLQVTSLAAGHDLIVLPPESALFPGSEQQLFPELGHYSMLFAPAVGAAVLEALRRGASEATESAKGDGEG